jgi:predicted ATP-dependent serine protease
MSRFVTAKEVIVPDEYFNRLSSGIETIDSLFSTGILPGSVTTIAAKHGTGKTQFCLQLLNALQEKSYKVGYVSNEESIEQLAFTCKRINTPNVPIANASSLKEVKELMQGLNVIVIDSFSKLRVDGETKVRSIERCILDTIIGEAKKTKCAVFFIMHLTKMGQVRGSSLIEHDVDATLFIKHNHEEDEPDNGQRKIYFEKNRFGSPNEVVVTITAKGYDFTEVEPDLSNDKKKDKTKKSDILQEDIKNLPYPEFTVDKAVEHLDLPHQKVLFAIYTMTRNGILVKEGRGKAATYKVV